MKRLMWIREAAESGQARAIRENARVSLRETARETDVAASTLDRWERGLNRPRRDAALRWARVLETIQRDGQPESSTHAEATA